MRFVETTVFTRQIQSLLTDDEYRALQSALVLRPQQGAVIRNSGGLRKIRWGSRGTGKRGGIRVVYYWDLSTESFFMLFAYPKSTLDDLSPGQLRILARVVREEFK
jgi:hypothetical protein